MAGTLFISDLHLANDRPEIVQLFIKFLDQRASHASQLYILGDLVEYWLGDDDPAEGLEPAFNAMKQCADRGLQIFLMHGNRDFLMGETFARRSGCQLIQDPYIANLNGVPALLMHGDTLCTDDLRYQQLRLMLRNPAWQADFLSKPLAERTEMARALREQSKDETQLKDEAIMDVNPQAVNQAFQQHGVRLMIHGHTHRPDIHSFELDQESVQRIVLGDWYNSGSYLELAPDNSFSLKAFD